MSILSEIEDVFGKYLQYFCILIGIFLSFQFINKGRMDSETIRKTARKVGFAFVLGYISFMAILEYSLDFYSKVAIPYFRRDYMVQKIMDDLVSPIDRFLSEYVLFMVVFVILLMVIQLFKLRKHYKEKVRNNFDFSYLVIATYALATYFIHFYAAEQVAFIFEYCCLIVLAAFFIFSLAAYLTTKYLRAHDS